MARYKYFNSGIYEDAFYTKHKIDFYNDHNAHENVEYDFELLAEHYKADLYFAYSDDNDKWEQEINERFWDALSHWTIYFEPLIFNEKIALKCGLTPFTYKGINMLALSGCGMDLSPKLDSYQVLSHNTIDQNSKFVSLGYRDIDYFEYVVGKKITEIVLQAISE